ncbi:glutamate-rich protein 6-like [Poeciliopsis prolifica]|uniref:glutamate-rich protein 6-like n=1 Tax=Poeciliopsis prolifica TaxID=188132 RepID=UPI002412E83E|nr:glutamate-rich protein 6-like [Poeciliopsis prolifica]
MEPNSSRETSPDILTIHTHDGRIVTRINVATQTSSRNEDLKFMPKYALLKKKADYYDSSAQRADDESELKISPDNEMLDLHSKGSPHSPKACQEGTEETLTKLDKGVTDGESGKESVRTPREPGLKSKQDSLGEGHEDYDTSSDFLDYDSSTSEEEGEKEMSYNSIFHFNVKKERLKTLPLIRRYKNGKIFNLVLQDGTGHVCYPSGSLAILVATSHSTNSSCVVVLDNKIDEPQIKALFTSREQTCFHANGKIWVNLTSTGGTLFSHTGDLKKRWKWQDNEQHVHAPPCQPMHLTLSPFLKVSIKSQEDISILFNSNKHSVEVNKEASVDAEHVRQETASVTDSLRSYLKQKSPEIKALLQNIQSLVTDQSSPTPSKVSPHPADGEAAAASEKATLPKRPPKADNVLQ